jgi:pimeloyl-ACP methyl ester carboxylesterase
MSSIKPWRACINGLQLAGLQWHAAQPGKTPMLALHGWLDNAASMRPLLEALHSQVGAPMLALDLPGHGMSAHTPKDWHAPFLDYVDHMLAVVETLNWPQIDLIGHSMGGAIATLFAAAFPERVRRLVLLDSIGPLSGSAENFSSDMRKGLLARRSVQQKILPSYASIDEAVAARTGSFGISAQATRVIVKRGLVKRGERYFWRTDPRLTTPSVSRITEPQVLQAIAAISAPTLLVLAQPRSAFLASALIENRMAQFKNAQVVEIPDSNHHLHLDSMPEVLPKVSEFLA